jgi:pentatricopeptide repeat protein
MDDPMIDSFNPHIFSSVIDAWANSYHSQAIDHAFDVISLMEQHARCIELNVQPSTGVFNNLLKCISNVTTSLSTTVTTTVPSFLDGASIQYATCHDASDNSESTSGDTANRCTLDTCRLSIAVANEMEQRYRKYGVGKPTIVTYSIIIKTCFRANNLELADQLMKRIELSDTPPDTRMYSSILIHYSSLKSTAGAEQAEKILLYLQEYARDKPRIRPNIVSYSIVLNAWANSGDPHAVDRMWTLYKLVRKEGLEIDGIFGSKLISFLSSLAVSVYNDQQSSQMTFTQPVELGTSRSSSSSNLLERALMVLEEMEGNKNVAKKPELRTYKQILEGYIHSNDLVAATSLVLRMVEVYSNGKNPHAKPNDNIFSLVATHWIKHGDLIKATKFVNKMQELYKMKQIPIGPSLTTYKALQLAWHRSSHSKREMYLSNVQSHIQDMEGVGSKGRRQSGKETASRNSSPAASSASATPMTFLEIANAVAAKQVRT